MKYNYIHIFILGLMVALPQLAFAQDSEPQVSGMLCEVRQMFCGDAAVVLVAVVIFIIGLLMFSGKINMGIVLLFAVTSAIFVAADQLAVLITGDDIINCPCE